MIAARQTDFIGKMMCGPPDRPSRNMITACCDHKQRVGLPQTTGTKFMVKNLRLLFRDVSTVHIDRFGSLRDWINEASNEEYWNKLVKRLLHPDTPLPERPGTWGLLPSWHARQAAKNMQCPTDHDTDDDKDTENISNAGSNIGDGNRESHRNEGSHGRGQRQHPPSPRRRSQFNPPTPAQYNPKRWLNDEDFCIQVGRSMFQSLMILGLELGASETEIKVHYQQLARKYHPDKNDTAITGLTTSEASTFFQLLNTTHQYLNDRARPIALTPPPSFKPSDLPSHPLGRTRDEDKRSEMRQGKL